MVSFTMRALNHDCVHASTGDILRLPSLILRLPSLHLRSIILSHISYSSVWLDFCTAKRKLSNVNCPLLLTTKCRQYFNKVKVDFGCDFTHCQSLSSCVALPRATIASVNTSVMIHSDTLSVAGLAFRKWAPIFFKTVCRCRSSCDATTHAFHHICVRKTYGTYIRLTKYVRLGVVTQAQTCDMNIRTPTERNYTRETNTFARKVARTVRHLSGSTSYTGRTPPP